MADDRLKAGGMGDAGEAGIPNDFADSMAAQMESELRAILIGEGRDPFDINDNSSDARDRRMLFVAIAQGIVKYLVANSGTFHLILSRDGGGRVTDARIVIKVANTPDVVINSE